MKTKHDARVQADYERRAEAEAEGIDLKAFMDMPPDNEFHLPIIAGTFRGARFEALLDAVSVGWERMPDVTNADGLVHRVYKRAEYDPGRRSSEVVERRVLR